MADDDRSSAVMDEDRRKSDETQQRHDDDIPEQGKAGGRAIPNRGLRIEDDDQPHRSER